MSELLTAKDVEVKIFKKVRFGGYSVPEVEDFLNQVADDLEAYVTQLDEKDARIQELESFVKKQEAMTDAIKDALIQARKAAKDMEEQARTQTEKILAEADEEAKKHVAEADGLVQARIDEAERKANDIIAQAKISAEEISQSTQNERAKAEYSLSNIEQELESKRREADEKANEILSSARAEAKKIIGDAERETAEYESQIRFLNLQKQQFLKDAYSLLIDFGKIVDRAQEDIDAETAEFPPEEIPAKEPENTPAPEIHTVKISEQPNEAAETVNDTAEEE